MSAPLKNVLFLCTGNSARSLIAECLINREGRGKFRGFSAGSNPTALPNPHAIALLETLEYDTSGLRSKSWAEFSEAGAPKMDFVFTVCGSAAAETCPIWPGQPISAHWGIPDPAAVTGTDAEIALAFAETHQLLLDRITTFTNLPIKDLDTLSLQTRLDTIGKTPDKQDA